MLIKIIEKMPVHSEFFKQVKTVITGQSTTLLNVLAVVLIGAIEAFVSGEKLFSCPTKGYATYGWAFILGPGIFFMLISLLMRNAFRKRIQGCCQRESVSNQAGDSWCPCRCTPRWGLPTKLLQIIAQSIVIGTMWIFMAFLQKDYYACARLGNKAAMETKALLDITDETQKKKIQLSIDEKFTKMYDQSQYMGLVLVALVLIISFVAITVHYCCYERPYYSLPKPVKYHKLEAHAAVNSFKEKMKEYAETQGKRQAEKFFSQNNPSVLIETYNELSGISAEYADAFPVNNGTATEAQAARKAFDDIASSTMKDKVELMFVGQAYRNLDQQQVRDGLIGQYPILSGTTVHTTDNDSRPLNTLH